MAGRYGHILTSAWFNILVSAGLKSGPENTTTSLLLILEASFTPFFLKCVVQLGTNLHDLGHKSCELLLDGTQRAYGVQVLRIKSSSGWQR